MDKTVAAILAQPDSTGTITVRRCADDGQTITHKATWGTGLARQALRKRYAQTFGQQSPQWLDLLHPAKEARILRAAINNETPAPNHPPNS
ncbi:hypothetical protein [Alteripontixanthobacter maritimus]|uniref:hypothetical protein n=1 Tax=Alteripontixanthobacter maritimus TaxID=2161824 RepID=UPI0011C01C15|nr:hypothetical protein [Alteripontixanthobacter maritimus]